MYYNHNGRTEPAIVLPNGDLTFPNLRPSANGAHPSVIDILRPGKPALCVCTACGVSWNEGGTTGKACV